MFHALAASFLGLLELSAAVAQPAGVLCTDPVRSISLRAGGSHSFRLVCSSLAAGNTQLHLRLGAQGCCALLFCQNSLSFALLPLVTQKLLIELLDTPLNIFSARGPQLHGHRLLLACLLKLGPVTLGTDFSRELVVPSLSSLAKIKVPCM